MLTTYRLHLKRIMIVILIINILTLGCVFLTLNRVEVLAKNINEENMCEEIAVADIEPVIEVLPETLNPVIEPELIFNDEMIEQTKETDIDSIIFDVTSKYPNIQPELVKSIIFHESSFNEDTTTNGHLGLMQISTRWHSDRAERLGVDDFYDPYGNILLGVDYLSELHTKYEDINLVLMLYNMRHDDAFRLYKEGRTTKYVKSVLELRDKYILEGGD